MFQLGCIPRSHTAQTLLVRRVTLHSPTLLGGGNHTEEVNRYGPQRMFDSFSLMEIYQDPVEFPRRRACKTPIS